MTEDLDTCRFRIILSMTIKDLTDILIGVLLNQPIYQFGEHWHFYRLRLPICECNMVLHLLFLKFSLTRNITVNLLKSEKQQVNNRMTRSPL